MDAVIFGATSNDGNLAAAVVVAAPLWPSPLRAVVDMAPSEPLRITAAAWPSMPSFMT